MIVFTEIINGICIIVVGDFNAKLAKQTMFGEILDKDILPCDPYNVSSSWATTF